MAMKRPAAASASGSPAPKAPKVAKPSGPILDVVKGINASDLPKHARGMLEEMLDLSLALSKEKRDKYQSKVVDLVAGVLAAVEEGMQSRVEWVAAQVSESNKEREEAESQAEAKDAEKATKSTDVLAKKEALAQAARSFWSAREAVDEAASKVLNHEVEASAKVEEKETLTKLSEDFQNQSEGSAADLAKRVSAMGASESMVLALPSMLAKPASERGSFDLMVFTSVQEWLDDRIRETSEAIAIAEPTKAANVAALSKAEETLKELRVEQLDSAEVYWKVRSEEEELESEAQKLRQSIRKLLNAARKYQDKNTKAQLVLETFQEGPKNAFEALRDGAEEVAAAADVEAAGEAGEAAEGAAQEPAAEVGAAAAE